MADERTTALREMAAHQGFRLKASRRRKAGGDFGKYGLEDADGRSVLGMGPSGLEASADEVEAFLRSRTRASWASSTKGLKRTKAPAPPPKPEPEPKPRFEPVIANLFARLPSASRHDALSELVSRAGTRIERVVSAHGASPDGEPRVLDHVVWMIVLAGEAELRIEDSAEVTLKPGDHVVVTQGQRHWITRTAHEPPTVWLAVHLG